MDTSRGSGANARTVWSFLASQPYASKLNANDWEDMLWEYATCLSIDDAALLCGGIKALAQGMRVRIRIRIRIDSDTLASTRIWPDCSERAHARRTSFVVRCR
jgi:hypothetical protein